jgi:hypothetical protein
MSNVQIRDVPQSVLDALKQSAAGRGQSLQGYLLELLTEQARLAVTTAVLDEAAANARRAGSQPFDSVALVREGRAERDARPAPDVPSPRSR